MFTAQRLVASTSPTAGMHSPHSKSDSKGSPMSAESLPATSLSANNSNTQLAHQFQNYLCNGGLGYPSPPTPSLNGLYPSNLHRGGLEAIQRQLQLNQLFQLQMAWKHQQQLKAMTETPIEEPNSPTNSDGRYSTDDSPTQPKRQRLERPATGGANVQPSFNISSASSCSLCALCGYTSESDEEFLEHCRMERANIVSEIKSLKTGTVVCMDTSSAIRSRYASTEQVRARKLKRRDDPARGAYLSSQNIDSPGVGSMISPLSEKRAGASSNSPNLQSPNSFVADGDNLTPNGEHQPIKIACPSCQIACSRFQVSDACAHLRCVTCWESSMAKCTVCAKVASNLKNVFC